MSSWKFDIKADVRGMDVLISRTSNPGKTLENICDDIVDEIVNTIVQKNIIDTGELRDSITHDPVGNLSRVIRDGVTYGVYNEFGTYKMAARPFFVPAIQKSTTIIDKWFTELLKI